MADGILFSSKRVCQLNYFCFAICGKFFILFCFAAGIRDVSDNSAVSDEYNTKVRTYVFPVLVYGF